MMYYSTRPHDTDIRRKKQRGFSLIELSVVLMIIGLLIGAAVTLVRPYVESYRYASTKKKLETIADAIALYVQQNNYVPCPSNPQTGADRGLPRSPGYKTTAPAYRTTGIVPYRVLGLDESQVIDAYGNFITYRYNKYLSCGVAATSTHQMIGKSIDPVNHYVSGGGTRYKNRNKTNFCQTHVRDMVSRNLAGDAHHLRDTHSTSSNSTEIVAFALYSHGKNGNNAFIPATGATSVGLTTGTPEGGHYAFSIDDNFTINPLNTNVGANYFDDIVIFRTNHQLMSAQGGAGCAVSWK